MTVGAWLRQLSWRLSEALSAYDADGATVWTHAEPAMLERARLLRNAGVRVGQETSIGRISIIGPLDQLEIGDNCQVQHGVGLVTDGWAAVTGPGRWRGTHIRILDNCAIFHGTWIMPGVTIGPNVIVVPGSVVIRDIPAGYVAMGEPARPIMTMDMWAERVEAVYRAHPEEFVAGTAGFHVHRVAVFATANWIETIRAQRERRGRSVEGLPSPEYIRQFAQASPKGRAGKRRTR